MVLEHCVFPTKFLVNQMFVFERVLDTLKYTQIFTVPSVIQMQTRISNGGQIITVLICQWLGQSSK